METPYIFISYSSDDKFIADAICHYLEENGIPCWIAPRDIQPGKTWAGAIVKAIRECVAMVLVYSKSSNSSIQVANEVDKAFSSNKMIIPFKLDTTPLSDDFEYYLSRTHWLVAYPDYKDMLGDLLKSVKQVYPARNLNKEPDLQKNEPMNSESHTSNTDNPKHEEPIAKSDAKPADRSYGTSLSEPEVIEKISGTHESNSVGITESIDSNPIFKTETIGESGTQPITESVKESVSPAESELIFEKPFKTEKDESYVNPKWHPSVSKEEREIIEKILQNMVFVEGGEMMLGATPEQDKRADKDEKPAHKVRLSPYWISKFTVTQKEWETLMGSNPSHYKADRRPVENVNFKDCKEFVEILNKYSGLPFALPTEAQWEYAARGGQKSKGYIYAGSDKLKEVAWYFSTDTTKTKEVGLKKPNELGLYDMSGNVEEWCDDSKGKYTDEDVVNPHYHYKKMAGLWTMYSDKVTRGGSYLGFKNSCRNSYRASNSPDTKSDTIGLRLVINTENNTL